MNKSFDIRQQNHMVVYMQQTEYETLKKKIAGGAYKLFLSREVSAKRLSSEEYQMTLEVNDSAKMFEELGLLWRVESFSEQARVGNHGISKDILEEVVSRYYKEAIEKIDKIPDLCRYLDLVKEEDTFLSPETKDKLSSRIYLRGITSAEDNAFFSGVWNSKKSFSSTIEDIRSIYDRREKEYLSVKFLPDIFKGKKQTVTFDYDRFQKVFDSMKDLFPSFNISYSSMHGKCLMNVMRCKKTIWSKKIDSDYFMEE